MLLLFVGGAGSGAAPPIPVDGPKVVATGFGFVAAKQVFAVVRYNADGSRDSSFGTGGLVTTSFGDSDTAFALAAQGDGKVVAVGSSLVGGNTLIALARYTTAGTLDATFGTGGKVTTQLAGSTADEALAVAVQGDGKIVVAGDTNGGTSNLSFFVARYSALGVLDATFGTGGAVVTNFGAASPTDGARAVLIQGDGKVVAAGETNGGTGGGLVNHFALARFSALGVLDATFGTGGKVITAVGSGNSIAFAAALQADGKIVAAGLATGGDGFQDFALVRYKTDGTLDTTGFGTAGVVITSVGGADSDAAFGVTLQGDGKVVAVGQATAAGFAAARYSSAGVLDPGFGTGGIVLLPAPVGTDQFNGVAVQDDGAIVGVGARDTNVGVIRYTAAGALDSGFGTAGLVNDSLGGAGGNASAVVLVAG